MKMKIATLAIITRRNQLLLGLKRGSPEIGVGTLNGPGGKKEETDKTVLDCLVREVEEEVGIILDPTKVEKTAIITFYAGSEPYMEVHVYRVKSFDGEPRETKTMIPRWVDSNRLPLDRMLESDSTWFPQAIRGDKFCAEVFYLEKAKGFINTKFSPFIDHD